MAETQAISKMAELLFDRVFSIFKWTKTGPMNINWDCVNSEMHNGRKKHPTDVVFYYDDIYSSSRSYINIDLKSYAKGSIGPASIQKALNNLVDSVTCANSSADWQNLYTHKGKNFDVHGLLFIFNHDSEYDSDFHNLLVKTDVTTANLPKNSRVHVFGPMQVCYLNSIATDLKTSLFDKKVTANEYDFFYPDLLRKAIVVPEWTCAATIEMLSSPFILVKYKSPSADHKYGIIVYYSRKGETREEFMYLIDYLFGYQIFQFASLIEVKMTFCSSLATANFQKAIEEYLNTTGEDSSDLSVRLKKISVSILENPKPQFSEIDIGMRDA